MSLNILIIDDSITTRAVLKKTLKIAEIPMNHVYEAGNGVEALELLAEHWIDLVFTDLNMPVMNGFELIEKIKSDDLLNSIPVVVVSTEGSQTRIDQLQRLGIRSYIRKPFVPETVRDVVNEMMEANYA